ncbi:DUF3667 domain-containing protein [Hymenobacter sp. BT523]|uniref:DUF3667 domain-containing protein n=1 Tax=Hymenobacter sp. BT523 TaxID=2795725 RepID=UPI0018EC43A8|nr:DUF3667 domain-containing protein [Hymenobacter sp. BT523]MBJ6110325.1 DUF3667 domain-containing protein [Hymenobacter sp. BT523]
MTHTPTCKNCHAALHGPYCHRCGQKKIRPEDRKLRHLAHEFFHHLTHLDGKFVAALRNLLTRPGLQAQDAIAGITVRHFSLSSLFLIATLLYFLFPNQHSIRSNMVTSYRQEVQGGGVGAFKRRLAEAKMRRQRLPEAQVAAGFDQRKQAYGKLLAFLLIPLTVPVLWAVNAGTRRFHGSHRLTAYDLGVAALEINSLVLIGFFLLGSLLASAAELAFANAYVVTAVVGASLLVLLCLLYRFFRTVFCLNSWPGLLALTLFLIGYTGALIAYGMLTFAILI